MSRGLTPQEQAEYNERRQKSLEETAGKLGLSPEQLQKIEQQARNGVLSKTPSAKSDSEAALRSALEKIGTGFIESLKTDDMRTALDTVKDVDGMSKEDFSSLLALRMSVLDEEERTEAAKVIARKIACWRGGEDEPLSLREEILLDLQAMIRRHNYYSEKK